jgi:DNA-binding SARP family transcriptional activator/TolB-like protein
MALSIRILGPLVIESDEYRRAKLPKKARALIAFLAAQRGAPVSRERLADLFWPFQGSEQARHSLRNCLLELRKALGRIAASHLIADFATCRLHDIVTDLDKFELLARSQHGADLQAAADLYRGEFLADFYINSEPFQEWLAAERGRTLAAVCDVLHRLAAQQDAANDHDAAIRSGRRLVTLDPLSELSQRALIRTYARAGRRGEALRQYKSCAEALQRELGVTPDAETQALANEIARSGALKTVHTGTSAVDKQGSAPLPATLSRQAMEARRSQAIAARGPETAKPAWPCVLPEISVAVARVRNLTGDPTQQHLVDAFSDDLVTDLLRHRRGLSLKPLLDEQSAAGTPSSPAGSDCAYDYVVTGSAHRSDPETLRLNMRIIDAVTAEYSWAGRHEFRPAELAPVQTRITRRISRELNVLLLQAATRRAFLATQEHGVNECLSRAARELQKGVCAEFSAEAQRWYLTALAREPKNVEALTGLAMTCEHLVSNPWWADPPTVAAAAELGRQAVAIALSIAPKNADAYCAQGMLYSAAGQLDEAACAFEQALTADQELGIAHGFAGYNAAFLGRANETLPAIKRAMRFDQADRRHGTWLFFGGFAELLLNRTESSIGLLQQALQRTPGSGSAQLFLTAALSLTGRRNEAAATAAKFRAQYPQYQAAAFEQVWISRSDCAAYRAQMHPLFTQVRALGLAN